MARGDKRLTVAGLRAVKGKRQLVMLRVESLDEAEAAEAAGIDLISVPPALLAQPGFRDAAPSLFCVASLSYGLHATAKDYLRAAFGALRAGADAVYCAASPRIIRRLAEERIPVCGHVGLIPSQAGWTGGFRAVGKDVASALEIWRAVRALEEAGAIMAEIEVVPEPVAAAICARSALILMSMGAGAGCDGQYLFATDVLGAHRGHYPRHARRYRDFAAEYARLQAERIGAFRDFAEDVARGAYPAPGHVVPLPDEVLLDFLRRLDEPPR